MGSIEPILTLLEIIAVLRIFKKVSAWLITGFLIATSSIMFAQDSDFSHKSPTEISTHLSPEVQIYVQQFKRDKEAIERKLDIAEASNIK